MKLFFSVTSVFCVALLAAPLIAFSAQSTAPDIPGWHLVWQDEFDGTTLDSSRWYVEDAALVKNNELQYYSPDEVYVHDGLLTLRSQKRPMGGREYTSGLVKTGGKFSRQFGRIEVRARLPRGQGLWPAHWMLPERGVWPPEIDIMESLGRQPQTIFMTLHWGVWPQHGQKGKFFTGPDFSQDFHVFAIEWEAECIRWLVDGKEQFRVTEHIPQEPFYIILNTAVGGDLPGNPNSATRFPQYHDIDYVRVYAREVPGTYILTTSATGGTVQVTPRQARYRAGETVTLTARPMIGYTFRRWDGVPQSEESTPRVLMTMDAHQDVRAVFTRDPVGPTVLSLHQEVSTTSDETLELQGPLAVDGNVSTRWSSQFGDPQRLEIDLGKQCRIEAVRLRWEVAHGRVYEIQVSDDRQQWKTVYRQAAGLGGVEEITNLNETGRYVAMHGIERGTQFGYSLYEFEVFGKDGAR